MDWNFLRNKPCNFNHHTVPLIPGSHNISVHFAFDVSEKDNDKKDWRGKKTWNLQSGYW